MNMSLVLGIPARIDIPVQSNTMYRTARHARPAKIKSKKGIDFFSLINFIARKRLAKGKLKKTSTMAKHRWIARIVTLSRIINLGRVS